MNLLQPDDPPPYWTDRARAHASVVFCCDHATNRVPTALGRLGLADAVFERHVAYDIGIAEVTRRVADQMGAPAVYAGYSRLVIDPNRFLDDAASIPAVSDGRPIPGNRNLSEADVQARQKEIFAPYHDRLARVLQSVKARGVVPALIAMHSFTERMNDVDRPWQIGVLWDRDPRIARPLMACLRERYPDLTIGDNEPYSMRSPRSHTIEMHAERTGLPNAAIEIRQDLIGDTVGQIQWAKVLVDVLRIVLADSTIHRVQQYYEEP